MEEIRKLLENWKRDKGSYIPNAPIYEAFISELDEAIKRQDRLDADSVFSLEELKEQIVLKFTWFYNVSIDGDVIIVEEEYEMDEDEKNSDDCCDDARDTGEMIVAEFPELEIEEYFCHRNKYSIVHLKLKSTK